MFKNRRLVAGILVLTLVALVLSCCVTGVAATKTRVFKIGTTVAGQHPHVLNSKKMAEILSKQSGGTMTIEVAESLGGDRDIIEQVQMGVLDMGIVAAQTLTSFATSAAGLNIPYLFENQDFMFDEVLYGKIGRKLLDAIETEAKDLKLLGVPYYDPRFVATSTKQVKNVEDFKGLKLRVLQDPCEIAMWKALGAIPTPIPFPEVYTSLSTGVVDGFISNFSTDAIYKFYEAYKYIVLTYHYNSLDVFIINKKLFESLTDKQRRIMMNSATEACKAMKDEIAKKLVPAWRKEVEANGVQIIDASPEMKAKIKEAAWVAYKQFLDHPPIKEFVTETDKLWAKMKKEYEK